jgi:hypothetical protein
MGWIIWYSPDNAGDCIKNPGIYEIEFSGYEVTVNSEVLVKKEGNIEVF